MERMRMGRLPGALSMLFAALIFYGASEAETHAGRLLVVYNNIPGSSKSNLSPGGGFAAWIESGEKVVLFDAGGDAGTLASNLGRSNLEASKITAVVLSHDHWDHTAGMSLLAGLGLDVHVPRLSTGESRSRVPGLTLVPGVSPRQILPGVWTTGALTAEYKGVPIVEQALVVVLKDGLIVVTGCAHVGIIEMVKAAKAMFPRNKIKLVAGGFHLRDRSGEEVKAISDALKELAVEKIGPSHCTGDAAIALFKKEWREGFADLYLGDQYLF